MTNEPIEPKKRRGVWVWVPPCSGIIGETHEALWVPCPRGVESDQIPLSYVSTSPPPEEDECREGDMIAGF